MTTPSEKETRGTPRAAETLLRPFYGWYVVAGVCVVMTVCAGLGFYNLSVYLKAFISSEGFSVAATSGATACFFVASGITGIGVAWFIERYDPRWIITAGAIVSAAAIMLAGYVHNIWQLYAFYVVFGSGYAATALIPGTTLVARWFARRRSIALSIASTGLSLGGIILTPVSVHLIDANGIGGAAPWLAAIFILGIVPVTWALIRPSPQSMGLGPDGDEIRRDETGMELPPDGIGFDAAVRSRFFLLFTTGYIFVMMAQVGAIAHQFRLVSMRTGSDDTAALAIAVMAGASIVGRLAGGWALAWMSSRLFVLGLIVTQAVALSFYAALHGQTALIANAALFGLTVGNLLMMAPLLIAEAFGLKAYGRLYSVNQFFMTLGVASGPALIGILEEATGGYDASFFLVAAGSLLAFGLIAAAGPVRQLMDQHAGDTASD